MTTPLEIIEQAEDGTIDRGTMLTLLSEGSFATEHFAEVRWAYLEARLTQDEYQTIEQVANPPST